MTSKLLFVLALSAASVSAQAFQPLRFAGVNIAGFGTYVLHMRSNHRLMFTSPQISDALQMVLVTSPRLALLSRSSVVRRLLV